MKFETISSKTLLGGLLLVLLVAFGAALTVGPVDISLFNAISSDPDTLMESLILTRL